MAKFLASCYGRSPGRSHN